MGQAVRDYGKVHSTFWSSDTLKGASDDARFLALYLLTCQHGNLAGVFRLPVAYAAEDTGWVPERLENGFRTLSECGWLMRCPRTGWTWIVNWLKWNKPDNPNQWKAVDKIIAQVPDALPFRSQIAGAMSPRGTVSEPFGNPTSTSTSTSTSLEEGAGETLAIPLDDGTEHVVSVGELAEYRAAYPKVDIAAECRKARVWCLNSPQNRKTRRGVGKFLNGWMSRAQTDAERNAPARAVTTPTPPRRREL